MGGCGGRNVWIVDKNIFGNNGIDIQCLERMLPNQREITLAYDPIKPYAPGSYTLEPAKVTYTNPETGKEETVESNALNITVNGTAAQGQAQGITTIYECGGQSIRSTSYTSSGGSMNIQIGGSTGSPMGGSTGAGNQFRLILAHISFYHASYHRPDALTCTRRRLRRKDPCCKFPIEHEESVTILSNQF